MHAEACGFPGPMLCRGRATEGFTETVRLTDGYGRSVFDLAGRIDDVLYVSLEGYDQDAEIHGISLFSKGGS